MIHFMSPSNGSTASPMREIRYSRITVHSSDAAIVAIRNFSTDARTIPAPT